MVASSSIFVLQRDDLDNTYFVASCGTNLVTFILASTFDLEVSNVYIYRLCMWRQTIIVLVDLGGMW